MTFTDEEQQTSPNNGYKRNLDFLKHCMGGRMNAPSSESYEILR